MQEYDVNYLDDPFVEEMIDGKIYLMARPDSRHLIIQRNLSEIVKEFSPVSFPEMTILLEDIFNFEDLELIE